MRKTISIAIVILLIITLLPACSSDTPSAAEETAAAEPSTADSTYVKPLDLFGGELNPFSDIEFPESYTPYKVDVNMNADFVFYELSLLTEDPEVVSFTAALLNAEEDDITALKQALQEGDLQETGMYGDTLEFEIEVKPVEADSDYYTDAVGYTVTLSTQLNEDMLVPYRQILKQNINSGAFQSMGADELIDQFDLAGNGSIIVVTGSVNYVNIGFNYELGEDFDKWSDYFLSDTYLGQDTVIYWGEENVFSFNYGELVTRVTLIPESNRVSFYQEVEGTDVNISDYVPPLSLIMVGFDKMCNYSSEDGNIYVGIRKEVFGDIDKGDGNNYIQYSDNGNGYDCFLVRYCRTEGKYYVQIQKNDLKAEYYYYAFEDKYTDMDGVEDISELKEQMQTIMNTDADMVMVHPINTFEQYIIDTFGVNSDALYDLPLG